MSAASPLIKPLSTKSLTKVWGREILGAPFSSAPGEKIGEIWFEPEEPVAKLLAKYLFTSEKLSVQVHPNDDQAPAGETGKEECWFVVGAEPGASLAIGFNEPISTEQMRSAALDGSIEGLLTWHQVKRGDFFYMPCGTVHAIGPGVTIIEIQQNCDVTYRLYDYGRPRELHLDEALAIAHGTPYAAHNHCHADFSQSLRLVAGPKFTLDLVVGGDLGHEARRAQGAAILLPITGSVSDAAGGIVAAGECAMVDGIHGLKFSPDSAVLIAASITE